MNLASFEKLAESDLVSDFLSGIGKIKYQLFSTSILTIFSGFKTDILSSLTKSLDNSFNWGGNVTADIKNWKKGEPTNEKCAAMSNNKMKSVKCEVQSNFMCESNVKPRYIYFLLTQTYSHPNFIMLSMSSKF